MTQQLKNDKRRRAGKEQFGVLVLLGSCACNPQPQKSDSAPPRLAPTKVEVTDRKPIETQAPGSIEDKCPGFLPPKKIGRIQRGLLSEISGAAASDEHPGVLWVHNDSGGGSRLYALNSSGELLRTFHLDVNSQDWEDIALSSRPGQRDYLYIADTGDNFSQRAEGVEIHRIKEPRNPLPLNKDERNDVEQIKKVDTMRLSFPDSPHDAEALLVDPWTDQILLITKERIGWPKIYSVDDFREEDVLTFEGTITPSSAQSTIHLVTGGDVSHDGHWIILRTYLGVYLFFREMNQTISEALAGPACQLQAPAELQGESIAFSRPPAEVENTVDQSSAPAFFTMSEGDGVDLFFSAPMAPRPTSPQKIEGPGRSLARPIAPHVRFTDGI
jgi:hypothetical protein